MSRSFSYVALLLATALASISCESGGSPISPSLPVPPSSNVDTVFMDDLTFQPPTGSRLHDGETLIIRVRVEARSSRGIGLAYIRESDGKTYFPGLSPFNPIYPYIDTESSLIPANGVYGLGRGGRKINVEVIFAPIPQPIPLTWDDVTFHQRIGHFMADW